MSNYRAPAIHPDTGETEMALFLDDLFGRHRYGVQFSDGKIFLEADVRLPADRAVPPQTQGEEK